MRKRGLFSAISIILILILAGTALAAYSADIAVTEDGTDAHEMLGCGVDANIQYMSDNDYFALATGLDTNISKVGIRQPHMLATDRITFAIPVPTSSSTALQFTTDETPIDSFDIIPSNDGFITIPDAAATELGNDFEIEQKGWVDTDAGADKNLVFKNKALTTYISGASDISSKLTAFGTYTEVGNMVANKGIVLNRVEAYNLTPPAGTIILLEINIQAQAGQKIRLALYDDNAGAPDNLLAETEEYTLTGTGWVSLPIPDTVVVNAQHWIAVNSDGGPTSFADGVGNHKFVAHAFGAFPDPFGAANNNANMGFNVRAGSGVITEVTATGISSGECTVKTEADGLFFGIGVDQTNSDSWPITGNLALNAPLYHTSLNASPFTTKDVVEHSCTVAGATWTSDGYSFDGNNDLINCGDDVSLDFGAAMTLEAWVNASAITPGNQFIIARDDGANRNYVLQLSPSAPNQALIFQFWTGGAAKTITFADYSTPYYNSPHHIVATYDGTWMNLYIDGASVVAPVAAVGAIDNDNVSFTVGDRVALDRDFTGVIGAVRAYSDALTPAEVLQNYNATKWKYDGLGVSYSEYELVGTGVFDNSNDWLLSQNNVMPYMEYYKHTVSSVLQAWYQPIDIVASTTLACIEDNGGSSTVLTASEITEGVDYWVGAQMLVTSAAGAVPEGEYRTVTSSAVGSATVTDAFSANLDVADEVTLSFGTLVDRQGADNDGRITWGVLPAGVAVTLGAMVSDYSGADVDPAATQDVAPVLTPPPASPADAARLLALADHPLTPMFHAFSEASGIYELYFWWIGSVILGLLLFGFTYKWLKNMMISGTIFCAFIGYTITQGIFDLWVIIILIMILAGCVMMEARRTA